MISYLASAAAGNAVQIFLSPPAGTRRWRLLRKRADTITAADDPGANVIHDGDDRMVFDRHALANDTEYFYRVFYLLAGQWIGAKSRAVTPKADFADLSVDVVSIVRERIDLGLATYVKRGLLRHKGGHIPVLFATPAFEDANFPIVTVHLTSNVPAERFVGESMGADVLADDEEHMEGIEGWLARIQILIVVWCPNGDVRSEMRKALGAIVMANLPVFEATEMSQVEPSFGDLDDMNTYPVPMYQATCTLTCLAPAAVVSSRVQLIKTTEVVFTP